MRPLRRPRQRRSRARGMVLTWQMRQQSSAPLPQGKSITRIVCTSRLIIWTISRSKQQSMPKCLLKGKRTRSVSLASTCPQFRLTAYSDRHVLHIAEARSRLGLSGATQLYCHSA